MALTQVTSAGLKDGEIVNADLHSAASVALSKLASTGALGSAVTATTQSASDDSTKLATTAFVQAAVTSLIDGAPGSLNTLNELAAAINDDSSYATTLTTALATKAVLTGSTNNTIATVTGANALTGEANLTFDGSVLNVVGNVDINNGTGQAHYEISQTNGNTVKFGLVSGSNIELSGSSNNDFYIKLNGNNERLRVTSGGDILLGTDHATIGMNTSDGSDNRVWSLCGGSDASQSRGAVITLYGNEAPINSNYGTLSLKAGNTNSSFIDFWTQGNERLRITSGGCVYTSNSFGIGADNRWKIRGNNSNTELAFEYSTSSTLADSNIKMFLNPSGRLNIKTVPAAVGGTMGDYGLMFQASTTPTDGQVIQGITFNPHDTQAGRARAGIAALANANGGSHPHAGADLVFMTRFSADGHDLDVATDERLRIDSSGNLGVGCTPTNGFVEIKNTGYNGGSTGLLTLEGGGESGVMFKTSGYGNDQHKIGTDNNGLMFFRVNAATRMHIKATGTVYVPNHLTSRNGIVQVQQVTSTTRFSGTLVANVIEGSSFTPKTSAPRFLIMIFCPVNTSDDSDAANQNTNPYYYGRLEYQKNSGSWLECDNQGSTSDQGGSAAHIELSPNRTGDNSDDHLSGNRYRMEHKQATVLVTNVGNVGTSGNVKFKLRVYAQHSNFLQIGQPHGHGTDDNYPVQPWGFTVFELAPDSNSYTAY